MQRIKRALIGPDSSDLKKTIKESPKPIVEVSFGAGLGRVYFIKPHTDIDKKELLDQLDTQPGGRKAMELVDHVLGGGPSLLTRTDSQALHHHRLFADLLSTRHDDYIKWMTQALNGFLDTKASLSMTLKELSCAPVRAVLAKGLFNLDKQPPEFMSALEALSTANIEQAKDFSTEVREMLMAMYHPKMIATLFGAVNVARTKYVENVSDFIAMQADIILQDLQAYAQGRVRPKNIISLTIIEKIKEKNKQMEDEAALLAELTSMTPDTLNSYLLDAYVKTLPGMMVAGDGVMAVVSCTLQFLANNKDMLNELRRVIAKTEDAMKDHATIYAFIEEDRRANRLLHRFYLEALRLRSLPQNAEDKQFSGLQWRYTEREIVIEKAEGESKVKNEIIKAKSAIVFLNNYALFNEEVWQEAARFNPARYEKKEAKVGTKPSAKPLAEMAMRLFSQGHRICPAKPVAEYLYKTFIMELVTHYDFVLSNKAEVTTEQLEIRLIPRPQNDVNLKAEEEVSSRRQNKM